MGKCLLSRNIPGSNLLERLGHYCEMRRLVNIRIPSAIVYATMPAKLLGP